MDLDAIIRHSEAESENSLHIEPTLENPRVHLLETSMRLLCVYMLQICKNTSILEVTQVDFKLIQLMCFAHKNRDLRAAEIC